MDGDKKMAVWEGGGEVLQSIKLPLAAYRWDLTGAEVMAAVVATYQLLI